MSSAILEKENKINEREKLPPFLVCFIIWLCFLPSYLNLFGVDFGVKESPFIIVSETDLNFNSDLHYDLLHYTLAGSFIHTILEWSAVVAAVFTAILAFASFNIRRDVTIPIIGAAFFSSAIMDAFHILVSERLIESNIAAVNMSPFTGAIARLFSGLIIIIAINYVFYQQKIDEIKFKERGIGFILTTGILFFALSSIVIQICVLQDSIPVTRFPNKFIERPYDIFPLMVFLISAFYVYPKFYKKHPSYFSYGLIMSSIPNVLAQVHMAFGTNNLYDNHFNIGHFLKIISYVVPLLGLLWDYGGIYTRLKEANVKLLGEIVHREKAEEEKSRIFNISLDLLCVADFDGYFKHLNPAWERVLGYKIDELFSKPYLDFIHPDDRERTKLEAEKIAQGATTLSFENRYICKDGSIKWLLWSAIPYTKEKIIYAAARDFTERKKIEEKLKETTGELIKSNKELEQFAYVASHDLQEPLRMITSYTQLLLKRYEDKLDSDAKEFMGYAVEGAKRMQELINDLLDYSRVGTRGKPFENVDCKILLEKVLFSLRAAISESNAKITYKDLPIISGDPTQLSQLFQNLVANAIKYRGNNTPEIFVSAEKQNEDWLFSVKDNGIGIDPKFVDRIFVIFQRLHTREKYAGTGIGLSICKKIIERHGGKIWVDTAENKGSTFYFTISDKGCEKEKSVSNNV